MSCVSCSGPGHHVLPPCSVDRQTGSQVAPSSAKACSSSLPSQLEKQNRSHFAFPPGSKWPHCRHINSETPTSQIHLAEKERFQTHGHKHSPILYNDEIFSLYISFHICPKNYPSGNPWATSRHRVETEPGLASATS